MDSLSSTLGTNYSSFSSLFPKYSSNDNNKNIFSKKDIIKISKNIPSFQPKFTSIIGIGNPIVDITAEINKEFIDKYGLHINEITFVNENNYKFFDELEEMSKETHTPGGSIQNTLRVASCCLNMKSANKNKFKISMLGSVGDDNNKKRIIKSLDKAGVNPILETIKGQETSRCGVGIVQKEKYRLADIRASKMLSEQFIENLKDIIYSHDSLLIEGYILNDNFNICKKICDNFKLNKKSVFLTLSATNIINENYQKFIEIANDSDIIVGNIYEAKEFAKYQNNEINKIYEIILKKLNPNNNRLLIITDLPKVVYCGKYDYINQRLNYILTEFNKNIDEETIENLNGIGGAFFGGFLSQYMNGYDIHDCCRIGLKASNEVMKQIGCILNENVNFIE